METYKSIREWKDGNISNFLKTSVSLNDFHDQVMRKVLEVAKSKLSMQKPPCDFAWFITGSGGRYEQGVISDQDHGIVYEVSNEETDAYFQAFGEEISFGLDCVGYPYCKGKIMSSNPMWCKSVKDWKKQILGWMEEESWEAIRYLQIFYDARVLYGNNYYIRELKSTIYDYQENYSSLLKRFSSNMKHLKNAIGPMGQIVVEQYGPYQGCVNLKYAAFLPYVNSIRLLSIKEGIFETSTIERIGRLIYKGGYEEVLKDCEYNFTQLIQYRLSLMQVQSYADTHYLNIKKLTRKQRKEIKRIIKVGKRLHNHVVSLT